MSPLAPVFAVIVDYTSIIDDIAGYSYFLVNVVYTTTSPSWLHSHDACTSEAGEATDLLLLDQASSSGRWQVSTKGSAVCFQHVPTV